MVELGFLVFFAATIFLGGYAFRLKRTNAALERRSAEWRRAAERAAEHSESVTAREDAIAQVAPGGLLVINPSREVVFVNESARAILGDHDAAGRRISEVAWGFDLASLVANALAGKIEKIQQTVVRDGRAYLAQARPIGKHGEFGAVVALQDVTELQRLGRARRDFVANISHDLRTPLTSLKLLVETLAKGAWNDANLAPDLIAKLDAEVESLHQLADELFDLAQIESGQAPLKLMSLALPSLIEKEMARFKLLAERRQIKLDVREIQNVHVLVDPDKFGKVLNNLVHNALKFTPVGGAVSVTAREAGEMIEICVRDTGIGIPAQDLPRIFERFYKVDRARSRGEKGTGLGLAIAKHLVEAHGGTLRVESVEGEGASFWFTVPRG